LASHPGAAAQRRALGCGRIGVVQEAASVTPELSDCIQRLRSALAKHVRLLDGLIAALIQHKSATALRSEEEAVPGELGSVLAPMLQAAGSSSGTLISLSKAPGLHTRDCYTIARSIVEVSINACFIIAEGPAAAERAMRHARQKSYRDLKRESVVGDNIIWLFHTGASDPENIEGLREAIDEFTSAAGREKGWTDLSVDARMARVGSRFGESVITPLHWARFAVYRHSSEILHGTLFGALYFFGHTTPKRPSSVEEFTESLGQQHMMILLACILALSAVVKCFHAAYGFSRALEATQRIVKGLDQLAYFQQRAAE